MRIAPPTVVGLVLASATTITTGCKWTEFDDLEKEAWVSTTTKPDGDASDFGLALQRGVTSTGGKLAVMGSSEVVYYTLTFSGNGDPKLSAGQGITDASSVPALSAQPILLADPSTNEVALVMEGLGNTMYVWHGEDTLNVVQIGGPSTPAAAAFVVATAGQPALPLVASADKVYPTFYPPATQPNPSPACQLVDNANVGVQVRAMGAFKLVDGSSTDDVVIWGTDGVLRLYPGTVFNCTTMSPPITLSAEVATNFMPGAGSQILILEERYALLVGHRDIGTTGDGFLALYDLRALNAGNPEPQLLGTPVTLADLRTAAVLTVGAQTYVVAGYPNAIVDGVKAGNVLVFPLSTTTGIDAAPAMTLHDAMPEGDQQFGRAVAVTQFNGSPVIAVGGDNEVFFYFRTALYDETRQ